MTKLAKLWKKENNSIRCQLCNHHCLIGKGQRGICGVRENREGKLYSLNYEKLIAQNVDPIEKKPFYHFMPGSLTYSIATPGCNFSCQWCQNYNISQINKEDGFSWQSIEKIKPKQVIKKAIENDCQSIAYTYTEPTIFYEFALDTMKLAKEKDLKNVWVSNGFFSKKCWDKIKKYLDAINIDLKGFENKIYQKYCGAKLKPVLENIKTIAKSKTHLELTSLIIPNVNDSREEAKKMATFIKKLSPETPWHISRFYPAYKMKNASPTPVKKLKEIKKIGQNIGLKNIHLGNI